MSRKEVSTKPAGPSPTADAGERFGEFELLGPVGRGAFGEVWKARHHVWHDQVAAVKLPTDPRYVRGLRREGVTAHALDHPNIVKPIAFDPFAPRPYLVMEFVDGQTLRDRLRRGPMSPAEAIDVLRPVLQALAYAHGRGVLHRDVKPENVLIGRDGTVKLTDFGLGRAENAVHQAAGGNSMVFSVDERQADSGTTADGSAAVVGSLEYMAPEVRAGREADGRADLYGVGVMLFELLTGERPAGTDVPGDLNPAVPSHLDDAFRRSYARLDNRFADAAAFLAALERPAPPAAGRAEFRPARTSGQTYTVARTAEGDAVPPTLKVVAETGCPGCGGTVAGDDQFCMHCGKQIVGVVVRCGRCGAFPGPSDKFCMFCGHDVRPQRFGETQA